MMMRQSIKRFIRTLTETIINESDINDVFEWIYRTIISNKPNSSGKVSGWIIKS